MKKLHEMSCEKRSSSRQVAKLVLIFFFRCIYAHICVLPVCIFAMCGVFPFLHVVLSFLSNYPVMKFKRKAIRYTKL